jgi:hypothetical protein
MGTKTAKLSTGYCLDGARQARAVDFLIDPLRAVIDSDSQSLVRILISTHGISSWDQFMGSVV